MNTINDTNSTSTSINYITPCAYKLPCGLCRLTMTQCPMDTPYPNITWTASDSTVTNPCGGATKAVIHND